jgi:hypothetical protein
MLLLTLAQEVIRNVFIKNISFTCVSGAKKVFHCLTQKALTGRKSSPLSLMTSVSAV